MPLKPDELHMSSGGGIIGHPRIAQYFHANFLQDREDRVDVVVKGT